MVANGRVLIADDDPDLLELLRARLELAGHSVIAAPDGRSAYELALEFEPDLAVLDVTMPYVNGFELVRRIRTNPETSDLPVIMLTASTTEEAMLRGFDVGVDDYMGKPFSTEKLLVRVNELLG